MEGEGNQAFILATLRSIRFLVLKAPNRKESLNDCQDRRIPSMHPGLFETPLWSAMILKKPLEGKEQKTYA